MHQFSTDDNDKSSKVNTFTKHFRIFCQRTSIRGVPKVESSKKRLLRYFWLLFVFISFIALYVLLLFLIQQFLNYDTIIKNSYLSSTSQDFPEVTICSKRFFAMSVEESKSPFDYLDEYSTKIYYNVDDLLNKGKVDEAYQLLQYKFSVSAFFHDRFEFIYNRTLNLVGNSAAQCSVHTNSGANTFSCAIRAVLNPNFLNCLAFRISDDSYTNSTGLNIQLNIPYQVKPSSPSIDRFNMDEYLSDIAGESGYENNRLYIHKVGDYPFDASYEAPFDCHYYNIYSVGGVNLLYYQTTTSTCLSDSSADPPTSFNVSYNDKTGALCQSLLIQSAIINQCGCLMYDEPTNNDSHPTIALCSDNPDSFNCSQLLALNLRDNAASACIKACNVTTYVPVLNLAPYVASDFSDIMKSMLLLNQNCMTQNNDTTATNQCCVCMNNLLGKEFPTVFNRVCPSDILTDSICLNNVNPSALAGSDSSSQTSSIVNCKFIYVKLQLQSTKTVRKETLAIELTSLLSQLAGVCAFITGLTFTFIGEVAEVVLMWISEARDRRNSA